VTERLPWLVLEDGGVAGYAYASRHRERAAYRWAADVSCYVAERARRRSIGKALYGALFELLSKQHYLRLYAGITLPNPASEALHRSVGFEPVGTYRSVGYKHGAWHDVRWYGLALGLRDVPLEPIPFARLYEVAQR
ncbi:MAG: N-acetyltransferase, partial [Candidatus Eremiobacteraeota bacterium]|nr:N-acetyltransferase [Candidatus Eremiobacteraeota bacterium]